MKALVFNEFFAKSELAAAHGTLERSFAGMQKQMIFEQRRDPEPPAADGTRVP